MKILLKFFICLFIVFIFNFTTSRASTSITYFYSDSIKIQNKNIEIVSDEILINTTNSTIENTLILQNTSDNETDVELVMPLENSEFNITIKNLSIQLNDTNVDYTKNDNGDYIVKSKISAHSVKNVHIQYQTENDLQNASMIKYNFDNFSDKKIGKLKINMNIDDKHIPLIEKIYPYHYNFDNNTISVEYYNYEVNTITKDFIVKKATFNNLLYGRDVELTDVERNIITEWYSNGKINIPNLDNEETNFNFAVQNVIDYQKIKNNVVFSEYCYPSEPLLYFMDFKENQSDDVIYKKPILKDKKICIDYVETEDGKDLYVNKNIATPDESGGRAIQEDLIKTPESVILRTEGTISNFYHNLGEKMIYVGCGIDKEDLKATEEEKISYVNQINADMYIRIEIYDGKLQYKNDSSGFPCRLGRGMFAYYDDNSLEIVKAFCTADVSYNLLDETVYNYNMFDYELFYSNYNDYSKNYHNDFYKNCIIKLSNDYITQNCEIPTVVQFVGNRVNNNGKYVVDFFNYAEYDTRGNNISIAVNDALKTAQAQSMLKANIQKNANTKSQIESKISGMTFVDNEKNIQEELSQKELETGQEEELRQKELETRTRKR